MGGGTDTVGGGVSVGGIHSIIVGLGLGPGTVSLLKWEQKQDVYTGAGGFGVKMSRFTFDHFTQ